MSHSKKIFKDRDPLMKIAPALPPMDLEAQAEALCQKAIEERVDDDKPSVAEFDVVNAQQKAPLSD